MKFKLVGEHVKKKEKWNHAYPLIGPYFGWIFYTFHIHGLIVMKLGMINRRQMNVCISICKLDDGVVGWWN